MRLSRIRVRATVRGAMWLSAVAIATPALALALWGCIYTGDAILCHPVTEPMGRGHSWAGLVVSIDGETTGPHCIEVELACSRVKPMRSQCGTTYRPFILPIDHPSNWIQPTATISRHCGGALGATWSLCRWRSARPQFQTWDETATELRMRIPAPLVLFCDLLACVVLGYRFARAHNFRPVPRFPVLRR